MRAPEGRTPLLIWSIALGTATVSAALVLRSEDWRGLPALHWLAPLMQVSQRVGETLLRLVEDRQCFTRRRLRLIIELAEIQDCTLRRLPTRQTSILDDAEVAMIFAVFLAIGAAQKHASAAECQRS